MPALLPSIGPAAGSCFSLSSITAAFVFVVPLFYTRLLSLLMDMLLLCPFPRRPWCLRADFLCNMVLTGTFNCSLVKIQYECDHGGYLYGATPDQYVGGKIPRFNVSVCSHGVGSLHSWTIICVIIDLICQVSLLGRLSPQNLPVSAILTVGMNLCCRFT